MTETKLRQKVVNAVLGWEGGAFGGEKHYDILNTYNAHTPLARNYAIKPTDDYCAATASAAWIRAGVAAIAPLEVSVPKMVVMAQNAGIWVEDDAYVPKLGDAMVYDWQDGKDYADADNKGYPDHVGIVVAVTNGVISVVEGNKGSAHAIGRREVAVNGRYIRGFICPNYASIADPEPVTPTASTVWVSLPVLRKGSTSGYVKTLQILLNKYNRSGLAEDGNFGSKTLAAVKAYQKARKLTADGVVGGLTWAQILK